MPITSGASAVGADGVASLQSLLSSAVTALSAFTPLTSAEKVLSPTGVPATDATNINNAVLALSTLGGGRVRLAGVPWSISSSITPQSRVTLVGDPGCTISHTAATHVIYGSSVAFTDFAVQGIAFLGPVTESPTSPQRARAAGTGAMSAVYLAGDLDPTGAGQAQLTNFTMRNCAVRNMTSLPIRIGGVRGKVVVTDCEFTNNQDAGFVFCQEVIFNNNHVNQSADNGVSVSRGNTKVTVVGNTFENCAYHGIWMAGFGTVTGPTNFTITGNVVKNVGYNGVHCDLAPKYGTITGNQLDGGFNRGPSDQSSDIESTGVYIGGYPGVSNRSTPTDYATGIVVAGNHIRQFARAGVYVVNAKNVAVHDNVISDIGTQYLADGTTAIASSDATQNIGIYIDQATTNTNISVQGNMVVDTRGTPYCNFAIVPSTPSATWTYWANNMFSLRNAYNLLDGLTSNTREITTPVRFDAGVKAVAGVTAGSNSAGGTVAGFDVNGAAASTRGVSWQTAGVKRWYASATSTAEAGGNAGSDFAMICYADDGTTAIATPLAVTRSTGAVTVGGLNAQPVTIKGRRVAVAGAATIAAGSTASAASAASNGANDSSGYVTATASASPTAASIATVTYATAYTATPKVVLTSRNAATAACQLYVTSESASGFTVSAGAAPAGNASLSFGYHVEG